MKQAQLFLKKMSQIILAIGFKHPNTNLVIYSY